MVDDFPVVSIWEASGSELALVGRVLAYRSLTFERRYLAPGAWQMVLPYDVAALAILPKRIISVDWRGETLPFRVETFNPTLDADTQEPVLTVGGTAALCMLGWEICWPSPGSALTSQPENGVYSGNAETVVRDLVSQNYVDRRGDPMDLQPNGNRGGQVKARVRFDNLLEVIAKKAKRGGIGVDVVLERTSDVGARFVLRIWEPADKTKRVRLTRKASTVREWSQESEAPKATHALVGGAGEGASRVFRQVSTTKSQESAQTWGGKRAVFVDGPETFDNPELDEAGQETLDDDAETNSLTFVAAEAEGLRAFRDYNVGDRGTGELISGGTVVEDVITSIGVTCDENGIDVVPGFGDPDRKDPAMTLAQMIQTLRRRVRQLETRR